MAELLHVGYGSFINQSHIVTVRRRLRNPVEISELAAAYGEGLILDLTEGRRTDSIIVMDSGHYVLSALLPEELERRSQQ